MKKLIFLISILLTTQAFAADFSVSDQTQQNHSDSGNIHVNAVRGAPPASSSHEAEVKTESHNQEAASSSHGESHGDAAHGVSSEGHADIAAILQQVNSKAQSHKSASAIPVVHQSKAFIFGAMFVVAVILIGIVYFLGRDEGGRFHWSLGSKFGFGVSLVLTCGLGSAVYANFVLIDIGEGIEDLAENIIPISEKLTAISIYQLEQSIELERAFRYGDASDKKSLEKFHKTVKHFKKLAHKVDEEFVNLEETILRVKAHSEEVASRLESALSDIYSLDAKHLAFEQLAEATIELIEKRDLDKAHILEAEIVNFENDLNKRLETLLLSLTHSSVELARAAEASEKSAAGTLMIVSLVSLCIGIVATLVISLSSTRKASRVAESLRVGAKEIAAAAGQVASSGQATATGATEQAASLQQTAAALEEVASMVERNSESADGAYDLSEKVRALSGNGDEAVEKCLSKWMRLRWQQIKLPRLLRALMKLPFRPICLL